MLPPNSQSISCGTTAVATDVCTLTCKNSATRLADLLSSSADPTYTVECTDASPGVWVYKRDGSTVNYAIAGEYSLTI